MQVSESKTKTKKKKQKKKPKNLSSVVDKMSQQVKTSAAKSANLSSIPVPPHSERRGQWHTNDKEMNVKPKKKTF